MKHCIRCKLEKPLSDFHADKSKRDGRVSSCKDCKSKYRKSYYQENADRLKAYSTAWHSENRESVLQKNKIRYEENIEAFRERRKKAYWADPQSAKEYNRDYARERAKKDPVYRLILRCRKRTWAAIVERGYKKRSKTFSLIGCDATALVSHLEKQFSRGMTWDNYGEWHVDHIIPLSSGSTLSEVESLCHYSNLQPLWARDNISKGARIE